MTNYPDIHVTKHPLESDIWIVVEDCLCPDGRVIPKGFTTDFASVPRWLWSFIPPHGLAAMASIRHDHRFVNCIGSQVETDAIYYYDLLTQHVPPAQARLMFWVVDHFGRRRWRLYQQALKADPAKGKA